MADLLRLHSRMKQEYHKVVKFFGEDPAKMRIDDFFGTFIAFITDFEVRTLDKAEPAVRQYQKLYLQCSPPPQTESCTGQQACSGRAGTQREEGEGEGRAC